MASPESVAAMSEEEFERQTLAVIKREFGPGGLARFLTSFRSGKGDYTRDRHQWLDDLSFEKIAQDLASPSEPTDPPATSR